MAPAAAQGFASVPLQEVPMRFQGLLMDVDRYGGTVVFPFGGHTHEVDTSPFEGNQDSDKALAYVREEAHAVLQCLTTRAMLELQHALDACGAAAAAAPRFGATALELHGSFDDLVEQLQDCVDRRREDFDLQAGSGTAVADLLVTATKLGHTSAAQQLLLIDLRANANEKDWILSPAQLATLEPERIAVLKLLLEMAPDLVHSTCTYDDGYRERMFDWTLLHGAASSGNVEAMRLLLHLAPELATAPTDRGILPIHAAASTGTPAAVQLLLEAAPETAAAGDDDGRLPVHFAAVGNDPADNLRALLHAGAPGLDVPTAEGWLPLHLVAADSESVALLLAAHPEAAGVADPDGRMPLHCAALSNRETATRLLLAAHPAAALAKDSQGRTPLQAALRHHSFEAARVLLPASGLSAAQLLNRLAALPNQQRQRLPPLYAALAAHLPLMPWQWQRLPTPCAGLGCALPAVLARSEAEAALLMAHLPPADAERLRTAALSLHRLQRSLQLGMPAHLVGRMLALALAD